MPKLKEEQKRNLLSNEFDAPPIPEKKPVEEELSEEDKKYVMYFKKELYLYTIYDPSAYKMS